MHSQFNAPTVVSVSEEKGPSESDLALGGGDVIVTCCFRQRACSGHRVGSMEELNSRGRCELFLVERTCATPGGSIHPGPSLQACRKGTTQH